MKIIYFSPKGQEIRAIRFGLPRLLTILLICLLAATFLVGFASRVFYSVRESKKMGLLESENRQLETLLTDLRAKSRHLESAIDFIKNRENIFRVFAELPEIDDDTWDIGTGGTDKRALIDRALYPLELDSSAIETRYKLEKMEKQMQLLLESLEQIETKLRNDHELRSHSPSVFPVIDGVVTSKFGLRVDPFIQKIKHHNGIDIVAPPGTPVVSPSDGIVEFARYQYTPKETLGKVIIINHGRGVRTRYGHLGKIFVKKGQKVKRFDKIGEIGNTGRSTGPHLHYEVLVNGQFQNPMNYILE